jgi:hypothetical protein
MPVQIDAFAGFEGQNIASVPVIGIATVAGSDATHLGNSGASWPTFPTAAPNVTIVILTSGTGSPAVRAITSNTPTALTVAAWAAGTPDATTHYKIVSYPYLEPFITPFDIQVNALDGMSCFAIETTIVNAGGSLASLKLQNPTGCTTEQARSVGTIAGTGLIGSGCIAIYVPVAHGLGSGHTLSFLSLNAYLTSEALGIYYDGTHVKVVWMAGGAGTTRVWTQTSNLALGAWNYIQFQEQLEYDGIVFHDQVVINIRDSTYALVETSGQVRYVANLGWTAFNTPSIGYFQPQGDNAVMYVDDVVLCLSGGWAPKYAHVVGKFPVTGEGTDKNWNEQISRAITAGTTLGGTMTCTVAATGMTGTPVTVTTAAIGAGATANTVATAIVTALKANANIAAFFAVTNPAGVVDLLVITTAATNGAPLALTFALGTCTGVTWGAQVQEALGATSAAKVATASQIPNDGDTTFLQHGSAVDNTKPANQSFQTTAAGITLSGSEAWLGVSGYAIARRNDALGLQWGARFRVAGTLKLLNGTANNNFYQTNPFLSAIVPGGGWASSDIDAANTECGIGRAANGTATSADVRLTQAYLEACYGLPETAATITAISPPIGSQCV